MLKVVWSSDWHLGLKTDDIDRTPEILSVAENVIDRAIKLQNDGHRVILVLGGDLFDSNNPSEAYISSFIGLLKKIKKHDLKTFVLVGNHEAIADPERISCLTFLKQAKAGYPSINLIDDIRFINVEENDCGPVRFTFLPHISKALISKKVSEGKLKKEITTQQYIDEKCERIQKKVDKNAQHFVFSHLNVRGAHGGSEENLLKKSEVFLPKCFTKENHEGYPLPTIIQGHIHTSQIINNIHVIGSPIFCSFGENEDKKYFCEISVPDLMDEKNKVDYIETNFRPFLELQLDMIGENRDFFSSDKVETFIDKVKEYIKNDRRPVVKIDVTINPESNNYDWASIRKELQEKHFERKAFVKNITPRVVVKKIARSVDQKINLTPKESVKVYLKKNLGDSPKKARMVWGFAQKYLED